MTTTAPISPDELRFRLRGDLHEPGDPAFEDACTLFNSMIAHRPRYVARCSAPDDVVATLAFARGQGLPVSVRAGGHSVTGACLAPGGVVLDVRPMSDIEIDVERRIARVGAGATWAQVDRATYAHGLATTGGRVSSTGVAGLTLGGGSGWLERKHGLACDNLLAVELVTADGRLVRADAVQNPELLWAHRGGGGNFGVVTTLELQLHPIPAQVLGGLALWPAERGRELLRLYRDVMHDAPEELSLGFLYLTAPAEDGVPAELQGRPVVAVAGMHCGTVEEGEAALRAIRAFGPPAADFFGPTTYPDLQCFLDDPPGYRNYWTAEHLDDLTEDAIKTICAHSERIPAGPAQLLIVTWGGAVARGEDTVMRGRGARYVVHPFLLWTDPQDDDAMITLGREYRDILRPWATGGVYLNFIGDEGDERVRAGFAQGGRLAAVKAVWDPDGVFRGHHAVRA